MPLGEEVAEEGGVGAPRARQAAARGAGGALGRAHEVIRAEEDVLGRALDGIRAHEKAPCRRSSRVAEDAIAEDAVAAVTTDGGSETTTSAPSGCAGPGAGEEIPCGDVACPAATTFCSAYNCAPHCEGGPGNHWTYQCVPLPAGCGACASCACPGDAIACTCESGDAGLVQSCYAY